MIVEDGGIELVSAGRLERGAVDASTELEREIVDGTTELDAPTEVDNIKELDMPSLVVRSADVLRAVELTNRVLVEPGDNCTQ